MLNSKIMSLKAFSIRLITSAIILSLTAFFTPDFNIANLYSLLFVALFLTILDYLFNSLLGKNTSSFVKGIIGFLVSIIILYGSQFIVSNYTISLASAIIGAIIYSIIASYISQNNSKTE